MTGDIRFGLSICPEVHRWRDTVAQARLAQELGYDSVWLPEHHLMAGYAPSPLLGLAGLIDVVPELTLGTDVVIGPFYHPVRLAEDAAVLQDMSEGRFVLGIALGYRPEEFAALGVPFGQRGRRLDETLDIVRHLWSARDVTFRGSQFDLDGVTIYPRLEAPPPIWVGGWVDAALRRAATKGDAWFPGPTATVEKVKACLEVYDSALAEVDRVRGELPIFRELWVADDRAGLAVGVNRLRALYQDDYLTWGHANVSGTEDIDRDRFIVGDPESVAAEIVRLQRELGVTHLVARLHFHGIDEGAVEKAMRLLAQRVRPEVEKALGSSLVSDPSPSV